jgi:hypothetical protein
MRRKGITLTLYMNSGVLAVIVGCDVSINKSANNERGYALILVQVRETDID